MFLLNRFISKIIQSGKQSKLPFRTIMMNHEDRIKSIDTYSISPQLRQKYLPTILLFYKQNLVETYETHNIYFFTFEFTTVDEKRGCQKLFDQIKQQN